MATFPATKRYYLTFRESDTGLTPSFLFFNNASTFAPISPPTINEVNGAGNGGGMYYFDYVFTTKNDPDVVFNVDGGASIPTEEIRYIRDVISPKDCFLDEPISQVVTDVWSDAGAYSSGQKGWLVDEIGMYGDPSATGSLFGQLVFVKEKVRGDTATLNDGNSVKDVYARIGAPVGASISADIAAVETKLGTPAGASVSADIAALQTTENTINSKIGTPSTTVSGDIAAAVTSIEGPQALSISAIAGGASFAPLTDTLHAIALKPGITPTQVADAVWDEPQASHVTAGTTAVTLANAAADALAVRKIQTGRWRIYNYQMLLYDTDGLTVLYTLNLLDQNGNPTNTAIFERVPA